MADATFRAGGLASGLDTNSIIEQLTAIEARPLDTLRARQTAYRSQVSILGGFISKLQALATAAKNLSNNGALAVKASSSNTAFTATPGTNASAGTFNVKVTSLARSELDRAQAFGTDDTVRGGTLIFNVNGTRYAEAANVVTIEDGESLESVAAKINSAGVPVSASVVNDGNGNRYLSVINKSTGYTTAAASDALVIEESTTGTVGTKQLAFAEQVQASNAQLTVNTVDITRQSNTVSDVISGVTLNLKTEGGAQETLTLDYDTSGTTANIQKFVDAYNDLMNGIQQQLKTGGANSGREATLAGDSSIKTLMQRMRTIITSEVSGLAGVRSLADLGLKTDAKEGTLSIDSSKLTSAIAQDWTAINKIFSEPTGGVYKQMQGLSDAYTRAVDGIFTLRNKNLNDTIRRMDDDAARLQSRIDSYKQNLIAQFTAMEQLVSSLKSTGNFLAQQATKQ